MIYLIAGHNSKGTGASGVRGTDEAEMTIELRDDIADNLRRAGVKVTTDDDRKSLRSVLRWLGSIVRPNDVVVDIHFNAFHSTAANGTEVFVSKNHTEREAKLARNILDAITESLGTRSRGVKTEDRSQHRSIGILSGRPAKAVNVLIEVCFITSPSDVSKYNANYGKMLERISEVLMNEAYCNG